MDAKKAVYRELVKTDKYGNQTFRTNKCRRCGGTGRIFWSGLMGGRCFECAGSGTAKEYRTVVYTHEQERLRDAKRRARHLGTVAEQLRVKGYGADGIGYIPTGETYSHRAEIAELGGYWDCARRRWVMPVAPAFSAYTTENAWDHAHVERIDEQGFGYDVVVWHFCD